MYKNVTKMQKIAKTKKIGSFFWFPFGKVHSAHKLQ